MLKSKGLDTTPQPWRKPDTKPWPQDTVWSEMWCTWHRQSLQQAVCCLRENHHPTMHNMPDALVMVRLEFNLQAAKKEKFIEASSKMVPVYNPFERGVAEKQILAFAKDPEACREAEASGALKAGEMEMVDEIVKGRMDVSDFDHFLAHEDILESLKPLIGILREKFPKKQNGNVASDLTKLVRTWTHGMLVNVTKPKSTLGFKEDSTFGVAEFPVAASTWTPSSLRTTSPLP